MVAQSGWVMGGRVIVRAHTVVMVRAGGEFVGTKSLFATTYITRSSNLSIVCVYCNKKQLFANNRAKVVPLS